jgi:hypothetical protein
MGLKQVSCGTPLGDKKRTRLRDVSTFNILALFVQKFKIILITYIETFIDNIFKTKMP